MTEYKLELLVKEPMGYPGLQARLESGVMDNPRFALAVYMQLDLNLRQIYFEKEKYNLIIYRDGQVISQEELTSDFKKQL
ncbi:MAG TPA: hypothetical protein VJC39_05645 [Candidatus Nanoarchaeia archaeon]|nr:hypothetical protein [Candidatus Nanoarchaeia archaeon]